MVDKMDVKLTLKLDKEVIEQAKVYAAASQKSLSRLIENYLRSLVQVESNRVMNDDDISPFVRGMSTGVHIPADLDADDFYRAQREEKQR